jgi:hypothetical protein
MPLPLRGVKFLQKEFTMKELDQFGYKIGDLPEGEGHQATNADLQDIWWYPEFSKTWVGYSETINIGYATAFRYLARRRGKQNATRDPGRASSAVDDPDPMSDEQMRVFARGARS